MSAAQKLARLAGVSVFGVLTGVYIFQPVFKQYAIDNNYALPSPSSSSSSKAVEGLADLTGANRSVGGVGADEVRSEDKIELARANAAGRAVEAAQARAKVQ